MKENTNIANVANVANVAIEQIRHSLSHVLAQALQQKIPGVLLGFGPNTENGFYYDFDLGQNTISENDLNELEKSMKKIIKQNQIFERFELEYSAATELLKKNKEEPYKLENLQKLNNQGITKFSFYKNGSFLDLCEGPHVSTTGQLPIDGFKLDRIAGAYWLGDEKRKMLVRIYGLAFATKAELDDFLKRREMAEALDHKKLGKSLEIFHFEEIVGPGLPLWLPNGTAIRNELEKLAFEMEFKFGYQRVATPHITKGDLYIKSQHLESYKDSMFPPMVLEDGDRKTEYYLKPMNCPHHHLIYSAKIRSYRDLPLRLAEYGTCYRYEQSGELSGLLRTRCMTMNDAHIYLRESQFEEEFANLLKMYTEYYALFQLSEYKFRLSVSGSEQSNKFKGDKSNWAHAELMLESSLKKAGIEYYVGEGEAAFYGPKIDIQFRNIAGREETVSTIQVDFLSPKNFDLKYIDEQGQPQLPIIIHRAPLSTHERFISYLIEYYGGAFPTWCAPIQVAIIPINAQCMDFCKDIYQKLHKHMIRVDLDDSDNSLNKKIRLHTTRKIPIQLIIGNKEAEHKTVTIRRYGITEQKTLNVDEFFEVLNNEIKNRLSSKKPLGSLI